MRSLIGALWVASTLAACAAPALPIAPAEFRQTLIGSWTGTVGDDRETIEFKGDGTFVARTKQLGFISNTLSQGVVGTIRGTWVIADRVIAMSVTGEEHEHVLDRSTTSTIITFVKNRITVRAGDGQTSAFERS